MTTEVRCIICRRLLRSPKSMANRMGRRCHTKYQHGTAGVQSTFAPTPQQLAEDQEILATLQDNGNIQDRLNADMRC